MGGFLNAFSAPRKPMRMFEMHALAVEDLGKFL